MRSARKPKIWRRIGQRKVHAFLQITSKEGQGDKEAAVEHTSGEDLSLIGWIVFSLLLSQERSIETCQKKILKPGAAVSFILHGVLV